MSGQHASKHRHAVYEIVGNVKQKVLHGWIYDFARRDLLQKFLFTDQTSVSFA